MTDTIIFDCETYPNCFTLCAEHAEYPLTWAFEISDYRDDTVQLIEWLRWLKENNVRMCGFNNLGFDYPVLHTLIQMGKASAGALYEKAMAIIQSEDRFAHIVYPSDRFIEQLDLYKINHFDNKARTTSLKALEFNMRMDNISDLPFPVGTILNPEQIKVLRDYCAHDVRATKQFYHHNTESIRFREELTAKHGRDFMNHSDVKIGKEIFQMELEKAGVQCYEYGPKGRQPRQTQRPSIRLAECIPDWIDLKHPEFRRVRDYFASQTITETKGAFKDIVAHVGGLEFVFGTGGIHASAENEYLTANDDMMLLDMDVTSLYPSIAIENEYYPQHLGPRFVEVYRNLREQRVSYKKGTAENAMLKLALNGVYGASNDKFSIFYDPLFTMKITIGGQLMLSMLAERLLDVDGVQIIQANTDGITAYLPRMCYDKVRAVCAEWEALTRLNLEYVEYARMAVQNVNNYICVDTKGKIKRKGAYDYEALWHQDASSLVIPKVAEQVLIYDKPLRETLMNWSDRMDFMSRVKVPRGSRLVMQKDGIDVPLENTQRYYVSQGGGHMFKIMPPLKGKTEWRRIGVESGWTVCPCNDIKDATLPINYEYYIGECEKLCLSVM